MNYLCYNLFHFLSTNFILYDGGENSKVTGLLLRKKNNIHEMTSLESVKVKCVRNVIQTLSFSFHVTNSLIQSISGEYLPHGNLCDKYWK